MSLFSVILAGLAAVLAAVLGAVAWFVWRTRSIAAEAERQVPMTGAFLTIGAHRVRYVEKGAGRPILFIHGLGAQLHQFTSTLFDGLDDDFRLVAIDRPGSGYSVAGPGWSGQMREQAQLVADVIHALKLEKPLVVGHSLGGAVALTLAVEHPHVLSGLALIAPHTHHTGEIAPEFSALNIPSPLRRRLISETVAVPASQKYAQQTLAYVFGPQTPPADYMTAGGGWLGLRPAHFFGSATDVVGSRIDYPGIIGRFGGIDMPVGILFGTADKVLDHRTHGVAMLEKIPNLDLELAEGVGHMPQFAVADRTAAFIHRIAARAFAPSPA